MVNTRFNTPRFSAFILHNLANRRCPETDVRVFRFELTNDTSQYPLGRVVCPQSGFPGKDDSVIENLCGNIQQLALLEKEDRLALLRQVIRRQCHIWEIGPLKPELLTHERLSDRGERLLQQSTADLITNPNGSLSLIMDYDMDLKGESLTALLAQQKQPQFQRLA